MKKCTDCDVEMSEGYGIRVDEPKSVDNEYRIYITNNEKEYFGKRISENEVKCRICPKCGKIELYINPDDLTKQKKGFRLF